MCGIEDHARIENRIERFHPLRHLRISDLELAAEVGLPPFVQANQDMNPALHLKPRMVIEGGVDIEMPAIAHLMDAAARKIRVGKPF